MAPNGLPAEWRSVPDDENALAFSYDVLRAVVAKVMELDGGPITHSQVGKTMRALIALGWNDWPESLKSGDSHTEEPAVKDEAEPSRFVAKSPL